MILPFIPPTKKMSPMKTKKYQVQKRLMTLKKKFRRKQSKKRKKKKTQKVI